LAAPQTPPRWHDDSFSFARPEAKNQMRSANPNKTTRTPREARALRVRIIRVLAEAPQAAVLIPIHRGRPALAGPWPDQMRRHPTLTQPISQPWWPAWDAQRPLPRAYRRYHHLLLAAPTSTGSGRLGSS